MAFDMGNVLSSVVDGVFGLADTSLGAYYDRKAASRANRYALEARSTAHQVEVQDLRKAGLNPVLSTMTGGATYSAPAPVQNQRPDAFSRGVRRLLNKETEIADANAEAAEADASVKKTKATLDRYIADFLKYNPAQRAQWIGQQLFGNSATGIMREGSGKLVDIIQKLMNRTSPDVSDGKSSAKGKTIYDMFDGAPPKPLPEMQKKVKERSKVEHDRSRKADREYLDEAKDDPEEWFRRKGELMDHFDPSIFY